MVNRDVYRLVTKRPPNSEGTGREIDTGRYHRVASSTLHLEVQRLLESDLLIARQVARSKREHVYDAADRAQQRLRFPVNPVIRSPQHRAAADALTEQIHANPHVVVPSRAGVRKKKPVREDRSSVWVARQAPKWSL